MYPFGRDLFQGHLYIFQDNLAPCYHAKIIKDYVTSLGNFVPLPWPGNSPDLNLIGNFWHILKRKVHELHPINKVELISAITDVWHNYIVDSCPRGVQLLFNQKVTQWNIRYALVFEFKDVTLSWFLFRSTVLFKTWVLLKDVLILWTHFDSA